MLKSVFQTCSPRQEILSGDLQLDLFAAKLKSVVEGKAPQVYQNPDLFFVNTFPTDGIKTLIREVFTRLSGKGSGSPILRLETSFGGGKTHDEIAIWHIAKSGRKIQGLDRFTDLDIIPTQAIQVAAIDGRDLDAQNGVIHQDTGVTTYTLWGEIAYQIGGVEGYQLLQKSDLTFLSPGTSVMEVLIKDKPTVIILDEIARYLSMARGKKVEDSNLAKQVVNFLFSLMDLASATNNLVLVYSLASSSDTFADETNELKELLSASARQERILTPSTDVEIYNIVKQRLFDSVDLEAGKIIASAYLQSFKTSPLNLPDSCKDATYAEAISQSYPFHPELFNLLTKKIATIAEFQRTRGALRLLAQLVRYVWQNYNNPENHLSLIHTHHLPIGKEEDITNELTSKIQRSTMRPAINADIYNPTGRRAYAQQQDEEWLIAGKPPLTSYLARTIFLHSLTYGISAGIRQAELNLSLLTPNIDINFIDRALNNLQTVAWYLDIDPITTIARFKEEPSINKIITEEKEQIGRGEAKEELRTRRDSIFAKKFFTVISAPDSPGDVDDRGDDIVLCLMDFDEVTITQSTEFAPSLLVSILNNTGESGRFRLYRNRLLFLVANKTEMERAISVTREYKAIQNILKSQTRLEDLSETQRKQLKERGGKRELDVRIALTNAYRHLFYPDFDQVKAPEGLKHYVLPAQDSSVVKGNSNQQDIILKALKDCQKIRTDEPLKPYAPAYIQQKVWAAGLDSITTKALKETFAKDLSLKFLLDQEVSLFRDTIRQGLIDGVWDLEVLSPSPVGEGLGVRANSERVGVKATYIKTDTPLTNLPQIIEFSDKYILYRRGILQPPQPKVIQLSAQIINSDTKEVRVRWKAKGALTVSLYQDNGLIRDDFRPSDEYATTIEGLTVFKVMVDYGRGETATQETKIDLLSQTVKEKSGNYTVNNDDIFETIKPSEIIKDGSVNITFNYLKDQCLDYKITAISSLILTVNTAMDYRKFGTTLSLLNRPQLWSINIDQTVTIQTQGQFVRLESQGDTKSFQSFFNTLNSLLNAPNTEANISLTLTIDFVNPINPDGAEFNMIFDAFKRNPVERLNLKATLIN
ncbi:ATP-binding protein [Geminocystis sp. CENA526]|uniref:ATP-binding protein n=1 Tax=Geminocystis sp. CENA526 TaxID=1355871 RepID=UPI003D6EB1AF